MTDVIVTEVDSAQVFTESSPYVEVVTNVTESPDVITIITQGLQGVPGEPGIGILPDGNANGDILRWNETDQSWEVTSEPFEFNQIVLTPSEVAALNKEGSLWYKSTEKSIYVCTDEV